MWSDEQAKRLAAEHKVMRDLAMQSNILEFETVGNPPEEYKIKLRGKGISRGSSFGGEVEYLDEHEIRIRLGYVFPERPPEIRFLTPIFHPNVSSIGYVRPEECGLEWQEDMTLDVLCERLWDVVRGAYVNEENSTNYSAKSWFAEQKEVQMPLDPRPLRDRGTPPTGSVAHYQRGPAAAEPKSDDILYISDETPAPAPPRTSPRKPPKEDDILYIGDE